MKKIRIIIAVLILAGIGFLIWWFMRPTEFLYAGTIEATEITLSARVASVIESVVVKEGEDIKAGQTLMTLSGEDLKLAARLAENDFKRAQKLFQSGSLSQADFDKIRFHHERADLLESWCTIQAPQAAKVLYLYHEPGEMVTPGTRLVTLADLSEVWAYIYVEQPRLATLSTGQTVEGVLPEMPGRIFKGQIALIRDQAEFTPKNVQTRNERTRLVYGIKVVFQNQANILKPGMTIEVRLPERKNHSPM